MRYPLPGPFAPRSAGVRGHQPQGFHLGGPFAVVVAVARGLTEVVLPQMHLLVNQRRQNFQVGSTDKGVGIEGDFIAGLIGVAVVEPLGAKVPACRRMAVEGDQRGLKSMDFKPQPPAAKRVCLNKRHQSPIGLKAVARRKFRLDRPTHATVVAPFDEYRKSQPIR